MQHYYSIHQQDPFMHVINRSPIDADNNEDNYDALVAKQP